MDTDSTKEWEIRSQPFSVSITFDTAWESPRPVFRRLVEIFPALRLTVHCDEEGDDTTWVMVFTGDDFKEKTDAS